MTQDPRTRRAWAAVALFPAQEPAAPVVFDTPHSGRCYPADFRPALPPEALRRSEDRFVDRLVASAPERGIALVAAGFARIYIDANRRLDEIDPAMLDDQWPGDVTPGRRVADGIGLVFARAADGRDIYARRLSVAEVQQRIATYWQPYHDALQQALNGAHERFGQVWHVNWHSMLPAGDDQSPDPGRSRPDFVLGDRHGRACDPAFTALAAGALEEMGYSVAVNDPYAGAELVERHGRPAEGRHSLQIEINRGLYLDLATLEPTPRFETLRAHLDRFAVAVRAFALGRCAQGTG